MTKRLSPERIAQWKAGEVNGFTRWHELMLHIDAIEAELVDQRQFDARNQVLRWEQTQIHEKELAEAKAEIARLKAELAELWERWPNHRE